MSEDSGGEHRNLKARSVYFLCDLHSSQPAKGQMRYDRMVRSYQVTICSYPVFPHRKKYVNSYSMRHDEDGELLHDAIQFTGRSKRLEETDWHQTFAQSVKEREKDYEKANSIEGFPQVLSFNFQAEYFRALFDYKTVTLIAKALIPDFKDNQNLKESLSVEDWIKTSVYLGDILDVTGLKTTFEKTSIELQTFLALEELKKLELNEEQIKEITEVINLTKEAETFKDKEKKETAKNRWKVLGAVGRTVLEVLKVAAPYITEYFPK